MEVILHIPHDIASQMADAGGDLARRALEAFTLDELKAGRITEPQLGEILGLARLQIDGFLKSRGVSEQVTLEDIAQDVADLKACLNA